MIYVIILLRKITLAYIELIYLSTSHNICLLRLDSVCHLR